LSEPAARDIRSDPLEGEAAGMVLGEFPDDLLDDLARAAADQGITFVSRIADLMMNATSTGPTELSPILIRGGFQLKKRAYRMPFRIWSPA